MNQPLKCSDMVVVAEGEQGHSFKLCLEGVALVLWRRSDQLNDGPLVADQRRNHAVANFVSQAVVLKHQLHVEQVAWMLAIECCTYLAAEQFAS